MTPTYRNEDEIKQSIVGDPLQLEPITTIPFEAEQAIRAHYGVEEEWLTGRGSVQGLADRLNRLGTTLPEPSGRYGSAHC